MQALLIIRTVFTNNCHHKPPYSKTTAIANWNISHALLRRVLALPGTLATALS
jgi:hypothetical protein